jgi:hypothetical protein
MRGRIVLFIVLAVAVALAAAYLGVSAGAPKAADKPPAAATPSPPAGSAPGRTPGPGPTRSPTGPSQQMPTAAPPTAVPSKAPTPKAGANPGGTATQPGHQPATKPQPSTGPVRFGKVTVTPSGDTALLEVAPSDHRALAATFSDRVVQAGPGATEPATRSFAMTLPLTDGAEGETLRVYVQGYAYVQESEGAYAQLTLKLNGQGPVRYYRSGWDDSFVEVLEAPATPATTYRLEGVVEVHQNPGTDGYATMNVLSVEASIKR